MGNLQKQSDNKQSATQEAITGVKAGKNVTIGDIFQNVYETVISFDFFPWLKQKKERERRFRGILLNRVEEFWLSDKSLPKKIELRLKIDYDCDSDIDRSPVFTTIENIFDEWRRGEALLILGEPGAGKTATLLQLAQSFINSARGEDSNEQVPVVFDLSSWGNERLPISNWLIKEFKIKYRVSEESLVKTWIKNGHLVLFLDGLNEVKAEYRAACVHAINDFMGTFGDIEIVVCSRIQEYKSLDKRLMSIKTVCVQPLTEEQISQYLYSCNENLKALLLQDSMLLELAKTPLMLNVMTQTHESLPQTGLLEERRKYVLNAYINQVFQRNRNRFGRKGETYKEREVRTWLKWLAERTSTVFLIEQMQPSWLTGNQIKAYQRTVTWYYGILSGTLFGACYGTILHYYLFHLFPETEQTLVKGVCFGIVQGIIVGPIAPHLQRLHKREIKTYQKVEFSSHNFRNSLFKSLSIGMGIGLSVFLISLLILPHWGEPYRGYTWQIGAIAACFFGIVVAVSRLTGDSFEDAPIEPTVRPNQGIWNALHHSLVIGMTAMVVIWITYLLIILILGKTDIVMFILGLCTAVLTGLVAMQTHGSGNSFLLHFALRRTLSRDGCIPKNYAAFLDYATDLTFMKKIGGGYKFYHQLFKEYFEEQNLNQIEG